MNDSRPTSKHTHADGTALDSRLEAVLEQAIAAASASELPPEAERQAAARVWDRLTREAGVVHALPAEPSSADAQRLADCADYQALIPAFLQDALAPAKALLLADHTRECITCRRALKQAQQGDATTKAPVRQIRKLGALRHGWAIAASLAVAVGLYGLYWSDPFGHDTSIAQIATLEGQLFRMEGNESRPIAAGDSIAEGEEIRTGRGSAAVVRLEDGSKIEVNERSAFAVVERRGETTIEVDRGSIIVEAAKQHGHLYVKTNDCLVSVTGTIFSVNHGTKGSRVAVVEGEVHVDHGRAKHVLHSGDQTSTSERNVSSSVADEIAWSRNREHYLTLLAEFQALEKDVDRAFATTGLRHDSRLLPLVPEATGIYLGLPNVSTQLATAYQAFEARLAQNGVLAQWWQERVGASGLDGQLSEMITRLADLGQHLGAEVVVALSVTAEGRPEQPLLLAEVANPAAFAATLATEVERLNREHPEMHLTIVSDPSSAETSSSHELLLWPAGDLFAAAADGQSLRDLAARLTSGSNPPFAGTTFHHRLTEAYSQGAQWLAGVDLARVIRHGETTPAALSFSGFDHAQHLIIERKVENETTHTGAVLHFDGERTGAASWLDAPAPMGSLDFVSADANFAASFVVKDPATILEQTFAFLNTTDSGFSQKLAAFEQEHGVSILDDLAAPLGGEMTVAIDGPSLPKPAWKVVAEVYDSAQLERAIAWAVEQANLELVEHGQQGGITHTSETIGGRTYFTLTETGHGVEVSYTYDSGYFVAGPSRALVDRALAVRASGYTLVDAPSFKALIPEDGYLDFSALAYSNVGTLGNQLLSVLAPNLSAEQLQAVDQLELGAPSLTCAYGESDLIRIVSTGQGGVLGSRLTSLLGLGTLLGGERNLAPETTVQQ